MPDDQTAGNSEQRSVLPDALFKLVTRAEALRFGLKLLESEAQYTARADLITEIPEGLDVSSSMFEFFRPATVMEFKSENDKFDLHEYALNDIRTDILFIRSGDKDYSRFLNLFVCARYPREFIKVARQNGISFKIDQQRPWLRWARSAPQTVALVVCQDLPIEQPFYRWLLFAPVKGKKWPAFIERLYNEGNEELLKLAKRLRPEEYKMLKFDDLMEQARREGLVTAQEEAQLKRKSVKAAAEIAGDLKGRHPLQVAQYFEDMTDADVVKVMDNIELRFLMMYVAYIEPEYFERAKKLAELSKRWEIIRAFFEAMSNSPTDWDGEMAFDSDDKA